MSARRNGGFTLLEAIIAMSILGISLVAIFDISSQAIYAHVYAKKLTVATLLARSKMIDLEQDLYDKGFSADTDEEAGDFTEEGWPSFKWRAKIIAPQTQGLTPDQLIGAIFNLPTGMGAAGAEGGGGGLGALAGLFGGGKPPAGAPADPNNPGGGLLAALGPAAGIAQGQFAQMVELLTRSVREVHLTVTWKEGKLTESFDLVTHVVSLGPGSDRNGGGAALAAQGIASAPGASQGGMVRADNGLPVPNPVPGRGGGMVDPSDQSPVISAEQFASQRGGSPGALQNIPGFLNGAARGLIPGGLSQPSLGPRPKPFQ